MKTHSRWHVYPLVSCFAAAALVLGSWFFVPTRLIWDSIDRNVFYALNGLLAGDVLAQKLTALASTHYFDALAGVMLVIPFLCYMRNGGREAVLERFCTGLFMALYIIFIFQFLRVALAGFERLSPSHILAPFYDLTLLQPSINAKVFAAGTFPSDHGMVMLMVTAFVWRFAGARYGSVNALMTVLFCLPRLTAGAHWATDMLVGSVVVALIMVSLALATPFENKAVSGLRRWLERHPSIKSLVLRMAAARYTK